MITLEKVGNALKFTFSGNSLYLQDGTIEVPLNSLTLVTDTSDLATFKKSASNDIFVSAPYSELGMTKLELETWFKNNACSTGGGGGGGVTPQEVQTMIDESISGKADTSSLSVYADSVEFDNVTNYVKFYHGGTGGTEVYSFDASSFVIDGMVDDVRIETLSGDSYLVIDFNTASGKEDIEIPISDIFDAENYYTKTEVDSAISAATNDMATQTWVGQQGYITGVDLSDYATLEALNEAVSGKADTSSVYTKSETSGATEIATALSGKQDTLSAGTNITIVDNVISATGGTTYSAGTGINIDSANTISGVYRGYLALDNPQSTINEYSGQLYVKAPWFDCAGSETGQTRFYLTSFADEYLFSFNPTTKQYELITYPQGKENDWQDYFTIEWDDTFELFKITTLQEVYSISDVGCSRLFRIGNQYNDYSFKYSGTTEDAFDGIAENFNNYIKTAYIYTTSNSLGIYKNYNSRQEQTDIQLEEIDGSNSKLKPNIVVGTGVSAWTEVQMNGCSLIGEVGTPVFRMYGDTSDLPNFDKNSFYTQWYIAIDNYGTTYDNISWNGGDFVLDSSWFGENGTLGTATVTYDDVQNILTIAYPLTVSPYGYDTKVKISNIYNNNCKFGTSITKFEYFGEVMQPLKPYIQETRAEVANKIPTSAITSAVTSASTNSEIPSAKAVYDTLGGLKLIKLTQAEYEALSPDYDNNALYVIV